MQWRNKTNLVLYQMQPTCRYGVCKSRGERVGMKCRWGARLQFFKKLCIVASSGDTKKSRKDCPLKKGRGGEWHVDADDGACRVEPDRDCGWFPGDFSDDWGKDARRVKWCVFDDDDSDQRDGILFSDYEGDAGIGDWRDFAGGAGECVVCRVFEEAGGRLACGVCRDGGDRAVLQRAGADCAVVYEDSRATRDGADG